MSGHLPFYETSDADIGMGSSLGNGHTWITLGPDGRIQTFFSTDIGEEVAGPLVIRYASPVGRKGNGGSASVPLAPAGVGRFVFTPVCQKHTFELPGDIGVEETVFVPQVEEGARGDETVAYLVVELSNRGRVRRSVSVHASARFAGTRRKPVIRGEYDSALKALFASEEENPDWVRVLASTHAPVAHAFTCDYGRTYDVATITRPDGDTSATGDVLGLLEVALDLEPGASERFAFVLAFGHEGRADVERRLKSLCDFDAILADSVAYVRRQVSVSQVMTPDTVINQGALWAKVNMLRVLAHYPEGEAFTNEPGVSSNVVVRDVAWYIYGCDHFRPQSSRKLIDKIVELQYESGKIPEYYDARTGRVEDYGLNINDDTPLFVLAVNHHTRSTGDFDHLKEIYDSVARAARYIMSQRDDRGLVVCTAEGVNVWGICGWRNVIPEYTLNGAVTEINAECAAALRAMGHMAENIGRDEDAKEFGDAARDLTAAINEHLLDKQTGLYVLNIDTKGRRHTDVTADEVFPVLFRVAPEEVAYRIIERLNNPDFWTQAGLRTVSRLDPLYDPAKYVGLLGGVWPGMTWWYALASSRYHPEFTVKALHASFEHYTRDPRVYNTVPGQFSEWFEGESLTNRGMRLSPWEPPRFLWAAVEGVCGMMLGPEEPAIRPLIPADWKWVALAKVPYHGGHVSFFAARQASEIHVYANTEFKSSGPKDVLPNDLTDKISVSHAGMHPIALGDDKRILVALGSCRHQATTAPVQLDGLLDADARYQLRRYSSERGEWEENESGSGGDFSVMGVRVEAHGYCLLEFTRA